jgi:hypothetical protein
MGKLIVIVAGIAGVYYLLGRFCPQAWSHGFGMFGAFIPWAFVVFAGFLFLVTRK